MIPPSALRTTLRPAIARATQSPGSIGAVRMMGGNVFHPPYDRKVVGGITLTVVLGGVGVIVSGFRHQQYKQGYWKKE